MKKLSVVTVVMILLPLFWQPSAHATARPLSDETLGEVTGQAGLAISTSNLGFDIAADTVYYRDADGIGPGTTAGFISLCGLKMKGSLDFASPMTITIGAEQDNGRGTRITGIGIKLSDLTLKIDSFYIDAIRLGSAPGLGGSLGSFGISNLTAKITGAISLSAN